MKYQSLGQVLLIDRESPKGRFISFENVIKRIKNLDPAVCYSGLIFNTLEKDPSNSPFKPFMLTAAGNERYAKNKVNGLILIPCGVN